MHMRVPGVLNFHMTNEGSKKRFPPISSTKHFRKLIIFCLIRKGTRKRRSNRTGISFFRLSSLRHQQNWARAPNHKNIVLKCQIMGCLPAFEISKFYLDSKSITDRIANCLWFPCLVISRKADLRKKETDETKYGNMIRNLGPKQEFWCVMRTWAV